MRKFNFLYIFLLILGLTSAAQAQLQVTAPTVQARYILFSNVTQNSMDVSCSYGNGTGRIVVVKEDNTWSGVDAAIGSSAYAITQTGNLANGVVVGATGAKVVADLTGNNRTVQLTGLANNKQYFVKVYEYIHFNGAYAYQGSDGILNPRSRTTLTSVNSISSLTAQISDMSGALNANGAFVYLKWTNGTSDNNMTYTLTIEKRSGEEGNYTWAPIAEYNNTDIGTLADAGQEEYIAELSAAGTYRAKVKGQYITNNTIYYTSTIASAEFTRLAANNTPPKFATAVLESGKVKVTFDQKVSKVSSGSITELTTTEFDIVDNLGADAGKIYKIEKNNDSTYTLSVAFIAEATAGKQYKVIPASSTSIYGLTGAAMNRFSGVANQETELLTGFVANVLSDNDQTVNDYYFATIADAIANTDAGQSVKLKNATTYSENVALNNAITVTQSASGDKPTATGNWTISGALVAGNMAVKDIKFAPTSGVAVHVADVSTSGTLSLEACDFLLASSTGAIKVDANRTTALANLNIGKTTANNYSIVAEATATKGIEFVKNAGAGLTAGITNINIQHNTFNDDLGLVFGSDDYTTLLPVINLGAANTNNDAMTLSPANYVYNAAELKDAQYLYPGIAVVNATSPLEGAGTAKKTVADAINAATTGQYVFLGKGEYTELIALNKDVNLVGNSSIVTNPLVVNYSSGTNAVNISKLTLNEGITVENNVSELTLDNNTILYNKDNTGINVTKKAIEKAINITNNTFKKTATDDGGKAIAFADNQFKAAVKLESNTFNFNANADKKDIGIYVSSTNTTGASEAAGKITIKSNTFNAAVNAPVVYNGAGDAIVFEDAVNTANTLVLGTINLESNAFNNVGLAIKVLDNATNTAFVGTTMPNLTMASSGNTLTDAKVYGLVWDDAIASATTLYPSITKAIAGNVAKLNIGAGTYLENVTIASAGSVTDIKGVGNPTLGATNTITLEKDLTSATGITASKVILNNAAAKMDDALALVKEEGTIQIADVTTITGDVTVAKGVTIEGAAAASSTGKFASKMTISSGKVKVQYITFETSADQTSIELVANNAVADKAGKVEILSNKFVNGSNNFTPIEIKADGAETHKNFAGVTVNANTFNNGNKAAIVNSLVTANCGLISDVWLTADGTNTGSTNNTFSNTATPRVSGFYWTGDLDKAGKINIDCENPMSAFSIDAVAMKTGVANLDVAAGYWAGYNTDLKVTVPLPATNTASYLGGKIVLHVQKDANTEAELKNAEGSTLETVISQAHVDAKKVEITVPKTILNNTHNKQNSDTLLTEGAKLKFNATISKMSGSSKKGTNTKEIIVDITAPTALNNKITAPLNNTYYNALQAITGSFAAAELDQTSGTAKGKIRLLVTKVDPTDNTVLKYYNSSLAKWQDSNTEATPSKQGTTISLSLTSSGIESVNGKYVVKAIFTDFVGNEYTTEPVTFMVDNQPPKLVSIARGTEANNDKIVLTFDKPMSEQSTNLPNNDLTENPYTVTITDRNNTATTHTVTTATRDGNTRQTVTLTLSTTNVISGLADCSTLKVAVIGVRDEANNTIVADNINNVKSYQKPDGTAPYVVSIKRQDAPTGANEGNSFLTNAAIVKYRVTFSEPVTHYETTTATPISTADFKVTAVETQTAKASGAIASIAAVAGNPTSYDVTVNVNETSDGGTLTVELADATKIYDMGCNGTTYTNAINQGANALTPETYTVDRKAPVVNGIAFTAPVAATKWNAGSKNITWNGAPTDGGGFSDAAIKLEYVDGSNPAVVITDPLLASNATIGAWTVPNNINSATGKIKMTVTDKAGNSSTKESDAFTIDNNKPTVESVVFTPATIITTTNEFKVAITFNEAMDATTNPVVAFSEAGLTAAGAEVLKNPQYLWTNDNKTCTATYTAANQSKTFTGLKATVTAAKDAAGNVMESHTSSETFAVDQAKPALSAITIASNNASPAFAKNGDEVTVTFTASKALNIATGGTTATIAGRPATLAVVDANAHKYTAKYTIPTNEATITEALLAFSITPKDLNGNAGDAVNATTENATSVTYDRTAPVITITAPLAEAKVNGTQALTFNVTETNPTSTLGKIANGTLTAVATNDLLSSLNGWVAADGEKTITLSHTDKAGNAFTIDRKVIVDMTKPTVSNVAFTPDMINSTPGEFKVAITFNEAMDNTVTPAIAFSEASLTTETTGVLALGSGSWNTPTNTVFTQTYASSDKSASFTGVKAIVTAAKDVAGNAMDEKTSENTFAVDQAKPTLSAVSIASNNANTAFAKNGDEVTVAFTASKALNITAGGTTATIAGQVATLAVADANAHKYTAKYIIPTGEATLGQGVLTFSITPKDVNGNAGAEVNATTNQSSVTYDRTAPVITISAPLVDAKVNGTQALTFTVADDNAGTETKGEIAGGTLTAVTSGALLSSLNGWNVISDGEKTITLSHTDKAGNIGTATVKVSVDLTKPTVTITRVQPTKGDKAAFYTSDNEVKFNIVFNEIVTGLTAAEITANLPETGMTVGTIAVTNQSNDGKTYLCTIPSVSGNGDLGIILDHANIKDEAGNAMAAGTTASPKFTIDQTKPSISSVAVNCDNNPVPNKAANRAARITYNEAVYSTVNASGVLAINNWAISKDGGLATIVGAPTLITPVTAGSQTYDITLTWSGTISSQEKLIVNHNNTNKVYDRAGNEADVVNTPANEAKNYDFTKLNLTNAPTLENDVVCSGTNKTFYASVTGAQTYTWYRGTDGSEWIAIEATSQYSFNNDRSELTITSVTNDMNGYKFKVKATGPCNTTGLESNIATLTVNPATAITTQPAALTVCKGEVANKVMRLVANGTGTLTYTWEYNTEGTTWATVADGTPANAKYANTNTANLTINDDAANKIAAGTYKYRVKIGSICGEVKTSDAATLTVNALPSNSLTVSSATICENTAASIIVTSAEANVTYQLFDGANASGTSVKATSTGNITLTSAAITTPGTKIFTVKATNEAGCSVVLANNATVTVQATPVAAILTPTPAAGTICEGAKVSASVATAGSGGTGEDVLESRFNGSGEWTSYTAADQLETTGKTKVEIRSRRAHGVCGSKDVTNVYTWNIEATPVAAILTASPAAGTICAGTQVSASVATAGSGGTGTDVLESRFDNAETWTTYEAGTQLATAGKTKVEIRAKRAVTACESPENTLTWTVNAIPATPVFTVADNPYCHDAAGATITLTKVADITYKVQKGSDAPTTPFEGGNTTTLTEGTYKIIATNASNCTSETAEIVITKKADFTPGTITTTNVCASNTESLIIPINTPINEVSYQLYKGNEAIGTPKVRQGTNAVNMINITTPVGVYTVRATKDGCTKTLVGAVTVRTNTAAPVLTPEQLTQTFCSSNSPKVSGLAMPNVAATTYRWYSVASGGVALAGATDLVTGTYYITADETGGCGESDRVAVSVTVNNALSGSLTLEATNNTTSFCGSATTTLTASGVQNPASWVWSTNANFTPTIAGANTNTYTVTNQTGATKTYYVKATDACGGADKTANITITVNTPPAKPTLADGQASQSFCQGKKVSNLEKPAAVLGTTLHWYKDNAEVTLQNPELVSGTYKLVAKAEGTGCLSEGTDVTVTVHELPLAPTSAPTQTFCGSATVANLLPAPSTTIKWYRDATGGSALEMTTQLSSGTYYAEAVNENGCASSLRTAVTVTLNSPAPPTVAIASNATNNTICAGTEVKFTATPNPSQGVTYTYQWKKNGTNVDNVTGATYTASDLSDKDAITCQITANANTACVATNAVASDAITIIVNALPEAPQVATPQTFCGSATVAQLQTIPSTTIKWYRDATGGSALETTTQLSSGTYYAEAVNALNCASSSRTAVTVNITVPTTPAVTIASDKGNIICERTEVTFTATPNPSQGVTYAYQWKKNGNNVTEQTGATYTVSDLANNDKISCQVTAGENTVCVSTTPVTSTAITMTVNALPSVTISGGNSAVAGTALVLTATQTEGYSYVWTATDGATIANGNTNAASFTWTGEGTKTVTVKVTSNGCVSTFTHNVTVTAAPVAPVIAGVNAAYALCEGKTLTIPATVTGAAPITYAWKVKTPNGDWTVMPDQTTATLNIASVTAAMSGNQYKLEATNTGGTTTSTVATLTVTSVVTPAVTIVSDKGNTICERTAVTFTATPTEIQGVTYTYQWKRNGNAIGGAIQSTYTVSDLVNNDKISCQVTAGENTVCVSTTPVASNTITMTVNALPSVTISGGSSVAAGTALVLTATQTAGYSYVWTATDGVTIANGNTNAASFTWTTEGSKTVKVTVTSNGCVKEFTHNVTVTAAPVAPVIAGVNAAYALCEGKPLTIQATVTGTASITYAWESKASATAAWAVMPDQTTATLNIASVIPTMNGTQYRLKATNAVGTTTSTEATLTVTSVVTPAVTIASNASNNTICERTEVTFTATPSHSEGVTYTYQWKKNGNAIGGAIQSTYTTSDLVNNDKISCQVTADANTVCVSTTPVTSAAITMTVNPLPSVTISGESTVAVGTALVLTATQTEGYSYVWTAEGATIENGNTNAASFTWTAEGSKTVKVTVTSNGCVKEFTHTVNVAIPQVPPAITGIESTYTLCAGSDLAIQAIATGTAPIAYAWESKAPNAADWTVLQGQSATTLTIASVTASMNGTQYRLKATNGAGTTISTEAHLVVNTAISAVAITSSTGTNNLPADGTSLQLIATVTGGTEPYTYVWTRDGSTLQGNNGSSINITTAGTYKVIVTDQHCSTTQGKEDTKTIEGATVAALTDFSVSARRLSLLARPTIANGETALILVRQNSSTSTYKPTVAEVNASIAGASSNYSIAPTISGSAYKVVGYVTLLDGLKSISNLLGGVQYEVIAYKVTVANGLVTGISNGISRVVRTLYKENEFDSEGNAELQANSFSVCRVMPNPAKNEIKYCINTQEDNVYEIELVNEAGAIVFSATQSLKAGETPLTLNLSQNGILNSGAYMLRVRNQYEALTQKVIVVR